MSATLTSLRVRNLALVEDLSWEPAAGFVAVTGETGAGKSIILGAINLLLGERADRSLVRTGTDTCTVEGVFDIAEGSPVHGLLESAGVEPCEDGCLILRRTVSTTGTGKQFANGSACTLALLRQLGDVLVDLHGPHDHQSLFSRERQIELLDAFAGAEGLRADYTRSRRAWMQLAEEKARLAEDAGATAREIDLLEHQTAEITEANLRPGEEDELIARQRTAAHAKRLGELCAQAAAACAGSDTSVEAGLSELVRLTREMHRLDTGAAPLADSAAALFEALQDFSRETERYGSHLDADPARLTEIEARLDVLQNLKRKYGATIEEVIAFGDSASRRLGELKAREERGAGIDETLDAALKERDKAARALSTARRKAAPKLATMVKRHLADLSLEKAGFSVEFEDCPEPGTHGAEEAEFQFSPNPGEAAKPLRTIASSGEISRVMLALKTALAAQEGVPVLIFDEIDANVGGEVGSKIGAKMRDLGQSRQVFCITHLPQVAAAAGSHYVVKKTVADGRTTTCLENLDAGSRVNEIARMLGGAAASAAAHAKTLLAQK